MVQRFDESYFRSLRVNQQAYINEIKKIKFEPYDTDDEAAISALSRIWYRSKVEGEEYAGAIYYRNIRGERKYGFGPAKKGYTIPFVAKVSVVDWQLPASVGNARLAGAYHTHVPSALSNPEAHSEHDKKMAMDLRGPVYLGTPKGLVKVVRPRQEPEVIGQVFQPDVAEHFLGPPPGRQLRESIQKNTKWLIDQLPNN